MFGEGDECPGDGEVGDAEDAEEEGGAAAGRGAAQGGEGEGEECCCAEERAQACDAEGCDAGFELDFDEEERCSPDDGEEEQGGEMAGWHGRGDSSVEGRGSVGSGTGVDSGEVSLEVVGFGEELEPGFGGERRAGESWAMVVSEEQGDDRSAGGDGLERGRVLVDGAGGLGVPVDDEVGVEAASGGAGFVGAAMVAGLEEAAVSVVAGEEVGLGEGEADGFVVFGFEEMDGLEAGEAGESLDVGVVHGDGEGAAAGGLAGVDLADEAGGAGENEVVGGEAGCGILPRGAHAAFEGRGLGGSEGHGNMVRRLGGVALVCPRAPADVSFRLRRAQRKR